MNSQSFDVAWDLDGTLADTEPLKKQAHQAAIAELGGEWLLTDLAYRSLIGQSSSAVKTAILTACGLGSIDHDQYLALKRGHYLALAEAEAQLHPGAFPLLTYLHNLGFKQIVVSSSGRREVDLIIAKTGIKPFIVDTVSADDTRRPKPDPEAYLLARRRFGIGRNVVVIEDTDSGCASALAAGCKVMAVRHSLNGPHTFKGVQHVTSVRAYTDPSLFLRQLRATLTA